MVILAFYSGHINMTGLCKLLALHRYILKSFIELQIDENLNNRRERVTSNVALFSYTRTFGYGPRNHDQVTRTTPELAPLS
ncbi:hypothetical protein TNCV_2813851 [Trichonephila clavipes]|nr:hypothetical protein TNCV_2813851 [Trichonephila clavipes]